MSIEKPPYRVPTMTEIAAVPWNGFNVVSTFSGCGGSCLGFKMAGFHVLWANEFIPAAAETYRANHPDTILSTQDIRKVQPEAILKAIGLKVGELDALEGSPPCASFSTAGKREKHWGKAKRYCVDPETPVLLTDLTWKSAGALTEGEQVIAFDEQTNGKRRKFRPACVTGVDRVIRPCVRLTTEDGATVVCSVEHRWLFVQGRNLRWRRTDQLEVGDQLLSIGRPWEADDSFDGGYLSGILDGEGCVSKQKDGNTRLLGFAQRPGKVLDHSVSLLMRSGVGFGAYPHKQGTFTININGGPFAKVCVLGLFRPRRLLEKANLLWEGVDVGATDKVRITSIEVLGEREVVALSTSAATFIADGLLSHNSDTVQRVDDLFFEYVRLLRGLQPKVFVAENVSGLVKGVAKGYFLEILGKLKACGYRVGCRVLDAQWLGVPQARQRTIFIGVREDLGKDPVFPKPLPYGYSLRDALPWIVRGKYGPAWKSADAPSPTVSAHGSYNPKTSHQGLELVEVRLTGGTGAAFDHKGKAFALDEPCPTILGTKPNQLTWKSSTCRGSPSPRNGIG